MGKVWDFRETVFKAHKRSLKMKNLYSLLSIPLSLLFILSGCSAIGDKSMSMSVIYVATTILSFLLLICYACFSNKKNVWL